MSRAASVALLDGSKFARLTVISCEICGALDEKIVIGQFYCGKFDVNLWRKSR